MKRILTYSCILAASVAALTSCGDSSSNKWTLEGHLTGASGGETVVVETRNFAGWNPTDTVEVGADGSFAVSRTAKGYPDIFRVNLGGTTVYFPIDSIETVTLEANLADVAGTYILTGSTDAEMMTAVDHQLATAIAAKGAGAVVTDSLLKRSLSEILLRDPGSIAAYYIINKNVDGWPLFSPDRRADRRVIGAVANIYNDRRPNDPRTAELRQLYLGNRFTTPSDTITAVSIGHHDLRLYDRSGKLRSLTDVTADAKVTLLNFTSYEADQSPEFNRLLNKVYTQWHPSGLEIYQVAVDADELAWRQAAANLPWITVRNAPEDGADALIKYNVGDLPATFVINGNGDITERVMNPSDISAAVGRALR